MHTFDLNPPEIIRARRLLSMVPGEPVLDDAALLIESGIIFDMGTYPELRAAHPATPVRDLGEVTLVPGLLNAHVHLGMCHLKGELAAGQGFPAWIRSMLAADMHAFDEQLVRRELAGMEEAGTCFVGDIATRHAELVAGILDDSGFFFVCFHEHIFFHEPAADHEFVPPGMFERGDFSAAGHAPYTTNGRAMRRAKDETLGLGLPFSLHLAEHPEETDMLMGRDNDFTELLHEANIPLTGFTPPMKSPVRYARDLGLLDEFTLAVHCVTVDDADMAILAETGTSVCLCPRSNEFIGVGRAPWEGLAAAGVNCCLGTDSLASNTDLDLWNEVRFVAERWQGRLTLEDAVAMVTANPARAMNAVHLGRLAPGMAGRWAVVPDDVEEFFAHV